MSTASRDWSGAPSSGDALAHLLLAAQEDDAFRRRLVGLLRLPATQRESLINTALHEMRLRGEPETACAAFATLATEAGAKTALSVLEGE